MKWMNQKGIWLSGYFLIMMFLFTRGFYTTFFVSLIGLLLLIVSFNEDVRLLAWMIISFFLGNLLLVYTDNFIESFHISPFSLIIVSQLLSLIPILMICYVIKQFKQEINIFINKPNFIGEIHLPFRMVFSIRRFTLLFSILAVLSVVGTLFLQKEALHWRPFLLILLFSIINAVLEEVLWRGILLPKLINITNQRIGLIVTSIAFGINTTMFGYSLILSIAFIFLGILLGVLTVQSKSVLPAILAHAVITTLLLMTGLMTIPI